MLSCGLKAMLVGNFVTEHQVIHMYHSIMYNVSSSYPCYEWTCKKMSLTYFKRRIKPDNRLKRSIGCFIPLYKYELAWIDKPNYMSKFISETIEELLWHIKNILWNRTLMSFKHRYQSIMKIQNEILTTDEDYIK
jgi:hypothetical protein